MIYNIYSVRDDAQNSFASPFVDVSHASAKRGFIFAFLNQNGILTFAPEDFRLYCIGKFDSSNGYVEAITPEFICSASEFSGLNYDMAFGEASAEVCDEFYEKVRP